MTTFTKNIFFKLAEESISEYPIYKDDGTNGAIFDKLGNILPINSDNAKSWPPKYVYSSLNPKAYKFSMKYNDSGFYLQKLKTNDLSYMLIGSYEGEELEVTEEELENLLSILTKEYVRRIGIFKDNETKKKLDGVEEWKKELNINI